MPVACGVLGGGVKSGYTSHAKPALFVSELPLHPGTHGRVGTGRAGCSPHPLAIAMQPRALYVLQLIIYTDQDGVTTHDPLLFDSYLIE